MTEHAPVPPPGRVADAIAERLVSAGVRVAFGVPGGEVLTVLDAMRAAGIAFTTSRHETSAGYMAEGAWSVDGAPGVVLATLGPGVANAVNAAAGALQDAVPLVIIGGNVHESKAVHYTHQVLDNAALMQPVTKKTFRVRPEEVDEIIDEAVSLAMASPRGPVYVDIDDETAQTARPAREARRKAVPAPAVVVGGARIDDIAGRLGNAKRPLVVAGLHAVQPGVADTDATSTAAALADLCDVLDAPCLTTYKAKGLLDETSPRSIAAFGLSPLADRTLTAFVKEADTVVLVGFDPIEVRENWLAPFAEKAWVVDVTPHEPRHRGVVADEVLVGDVPGTLRALSRSLERESASWSDGAPLRVRQEIESAFRSREAWDVAAILSTVAEALPDECAITADTGAFRILLSQQWRMKTSMSLLQSSGLCTMACALPLALGVKARRPDAHVACVVGDGGLEMGLGELATARDMGGALPLIVLDDSSYALIEMKQRRRELDNVGVDLGATDFAELGVAMGGLSASPRTCDELSEAIARALKADRFTIIHCRIDRRAYDGRI